MRWMTKFRLLILMAFIALSLPSMVLSSASDMPYIYYYSLPQQAFIVERADGTDSRVLANYQFPDDHNEILGPGWSESGDWFAWTSRAPGGRSPYNMHVYLVNQAGDDALTVLDEANPGYFIDTLRWSPGRDLLLIVYAEYDDAVGESTYKVVIYDPMRQEIIFKLQAPDVESYWFRRVEWIENGMAISLFDGGKASLFWLDGSPSRFIHSSNDATDSCSSFGYLPHFFADDQVAYLTPEGTELVIENIRGQHRRIIALPDGFVTLVDWSPDHSYALVYVKPDKNEFKYALWLLNTAAGAIELVSPDVRFSSNCNEPFTESGWNNHQAAFVSGTGELKLVHADSLVVTLIEMAVEGEHDRFTPVRWTPDERLMFIWYDPELYNSQIYLYNPALNTASLFETSDMAHGIDTRYISNFVNGYFAYNVSGRGFIAHLKIGTQRELHFQFDGRSYGFEAVSWHSDGEWLFMLTGPYETLSRVNIIAFDGSSQRQLAWCPYYAVNNHACAGFVPAA